MSTELMIELYGYLGSLLVVISMLMSSVMKLRIINTVGSIVSGSYALMIGSFPLTLMNICLLIINVYNMRKLMKTEKNFDLIAAKAEDSFLNYFLEAYQEDIAKYFPNFLMKQEIYDTIYIVCYNLEPAGVLVGKRLKENVIDISLEYTTPVYRDCSVGKYLYSELSKRGICKLIFKEKAEAHVPYLEKMGYVETKEGYVRE